MKACLCTRRKDINAQLNVENSIFPRFGRSRGSEKLTSIAKSNFQKTKTTCGAKDSEAVILERDKGKNNVCVKTTAITIPSSYENKEHNNINGLSETTNKVQRTQVLHTDLWEFEEDSARERREKWMLLHLIYLWHVIFNPTQKW